MYVLNIGSDDEWVVSIIIMPKMGLELMIPRSRIARFTNWAS